MPAVKQIDFTSIFSLHAGHAPTEPLTHKISEAKHGYPVGKYTPKTEENEGLEDESNDTEDESADTY